MVAPSENDVPVTGMPFVDLATYVSNDMARLALWLTTSSFVQLGEHYRTQQSEFKNVFHFFDFFF